MITLPVKPAIVFTESRTIPVAIRRYVFLRDEGRCVTPGCGSKVDPEYDHCPPWNSMPEGEHYHDPDKIFIRCKVHHKEKSRKDTRGAASWKRVGKKHRGETLPKGNIHSAGFRKDGPKRKIQSPGFQKRPKR